MKNRKFTKVALIALAMVLVCIVSVAGTLAYLTSQTDEVVNTFTVGDVEITLDEAKVTADGVGVEGAARVMENEYKLIPNHSYTKDPTVHVDADSEDCWVFVKVDNGIAGIEATAGDGYVTIATQMSDNGWTLVDGQTDIYAYKAIAKAGENLQVFGSFKVDGDVDGAGLETYADAKITVQAYAVQADGFATAAAAFEATEWAN
ncbi:MAG: hypothetical protein E7597_03555 [Ruminococcaceae bacterium]|nr:hypothetical protein [Oscillospiraceae bacterium]